MKNSFAIALAFIIGIGSLTMISNAQSGSAPKDGELSFPSDYEKFPKFLHGIQKSNAVRDLYVNPTGEKALKGKAFPDGSVLVMAIFSPKKGADGEFEKDSSDKLIKDKLAKVYVMEKRKGWGNNAPKDLKNGDWIYSAFSADGKPIEVDYAKCRSCHLPLGESKDFVQRYDEYFEKRGQHVH